MKSLLLGSFALALFLPAGQASKPFAADHPIACDSCDGWNAARTPSRIFGNSYYVGTAALAAVLVTSDAGHVLLDGALPQSAPLIEANIRALGFRLQDVRLILNSHAHFDHGGGINALQRGSGAEVAASAWGARALEQGRPLEDDPQTEMGPAEQQFPKVSKVRAVKDGETLRVGPIEVTAHMTPGHTPGGTTWSWRSCEGSTCRAVVYADSLNPVSADGFRFTGNGKQPSRVDGFRRSIATVAALPCDILIAVHPSFGEGRSCEAYAEDATRRLDERIAVERK